MCLVLLAYRVHPRHRLVLAANRDEFTARPATPLHWWDDPRGILAGRDLEAGGSWCGLDAAGRLALVTNYRDPSTARPKLRSRGELVSGYLAGRRSAADYVTDVAARAGQYAGFNLLALDAAGLGYVTSHPEPASRMLEPGVYALSNGNLDTPWPKTERARALFERELASHPVSPAALMRILSDRGRAADGELPDTGVGLDWERILSAAFIVAEGYGTRCTTVALLGEDGGVAVEERSHATDGDTTGRIRMAYQSVTPG